MAVIPNPFTGAATQVVSPSGDATGAKDAAAILAAVASLPATGGVVQLAATGTWNILCGQVIINRTGVYINAPGVFINAVGAGTVIDMHDTSTYTARTFAGGGILGFPVIDGTHTTGASQAIHAGDINMLQMFVQAQNFGFAGSKAVWLDNRTAQTEGMTGFIYSQSCAGGIVFDMHAPGNGSYDRFTGTLRIDTNGVGDGVSFINGAFVTNHQLYINGNMNTSTTQYACLRIGGSSDGSFIKNGQLNIGVELDDTTNLAPYTIFFGGGGNSLFGNGNIDFSQFDAFKSSNNAGQFIFTGPCFGDANLSSIATLGSATFTQAITGNGQTIFSSFFDGNAVTGTGGFTGLILAPGLLDGQSVTILNTTVGSLTFAAAGTSHVANGAGAIITTLTAARFVYDLSASLWYRCV